MGSEKISTFDDLSLIQLIVERGPEVAEQKVKGVMKTDEAVAETIENNVRKLIINETPVDPTYYDKMSKLLDALIEQRRKGVLSYKSYLEKIAALTRQVKTPDGAEGYPAEIQSGAQRALFGVLNRNAELALAVDTAIHDARKDGWRDHSIKRKEVRRAIKTVLERNAQAQGVAIHGPNHIADTSGLEPEIDRLLELARHQRDY